MTKELCIWCGSLTASDLCDACAIEDKERGYRFTALVRFISGRGIKVVEHESLETWKEVSKTPDFYDAPFCKNIGIRWNGREIHYHGRIPWPTLLHEAGHLLCCKKNPQASSDYDFLGWELRVCYRLKLPLYDWYLDNEGYSVNWDPESESGEDYSSIGDIPFGSADWIKFVQQHLLQQIPEFPSGFTMPPKEAQLEGP